MSLGDSLMPDRTQAVGQRQEVAGPASGAAQTPTEALFTRTDANLDGEFASLFGAGGPGARTALEQAAASEGPSAYDRFRADPEAFGTVVGDRSRADVLGGASEALAYSKAYHAAEQESRDTTVPGYGRITDAMPRSEADQAGEPGAAEQSGTVTAFETEQAVERTHGGDGASGLRTPEQTGVSERPIRERAREDSAEAGTAHALVQPQVLGPGQRADVDPQVSTTTSLEHLDYNLEKSASYTGDVGPSPQHILIAKGLSRKQVLMVLGTMQDLTDDRLVYSTLPDGSRSVKIASLGTGDKTAGTRLIRRLNSSPHSVTIDVNNSLGYFSGGSGNRAMAVNYTAATTGVGSNAIVNFDPSSNPLISTENSRTGNVTGAHRPNEIGLGHELIHAEHYVDGDSSPVGQTSSHTYKDTSGITVTQTQRTEELRTVGLAGVKKDDITENEIRSENKLRKRGAY